MVSTAAYFNLEEEVTMAQLFPTTIHERYFTLSSIPVTSLSETSWNSVCQMDADATFQSNSRPKNRWKIVWRWIKWVLLFTLQWIKLITRQWKQLQKITSNWNLKQNKLKKKQKHNRTKWRGEYNFLLAFPYSLIHMFYFSFLFFCH